MSGIVFSKTVEVSTSHEFVDWYPTHARIELTRGQVEAIIDMAEVAAVKDYHEIRRFDYTTEFGFTDDNDAFVLPRTDDELMDASTDCNEICVSVVENSRDVRWEALLKHTAIRLSTRRMDLEELKAAVSG